MTKRLRWLAVAWLAGAPVLADEIDDRVRAIDDGLYRIKDKLDGLVSRSDSSNVDTALDTLNSVKDNVERLKSLNPPNDPARTMASSYLDWIPRFRESAQYLKRMKDAQVKADESRLFERCTEADKTLRSLMQGFVERKDPNGPSKISDEAEKVGRAYGDEYKRLLDVHAEMDRWRGYARNFSESHNRWSDVRGELSDGVNELWDRWTRRIDETRSRCAELSKGRDADAVKDALSKLGDSGRARQAAIDRVNQLLDQAANSLNGAGQRTGTSELDAALSTSRELASQLDALRSIRGEEETAKRMSDTWPERNKDFARSVELLKGAKPQQFSFEALAEGCKTTEDQLLGTVRAYLSAPDDAVEGLKVVTERAERFGTETRAKLEAADRRLQELERTMNDAKRFSFDEGRWRSVRDRTHEAASAMYQYAKTKNDEGKNACAKLSQGTNHPEVRDALGKLANQNQLVKAALERIQRDYDEWKKERLGLKPKGRFRQESADKLLQAFCDVDELQIKDRVQRVADEVAQVMGNLQRGLLDRLKRLLDDLKAIDTTKNPTAKAEITRQRTNMTRAYKRLEDAGNLGILRGRNNPLVNMYLENGNKKHAALQTGCTAMEYEIPGGRIDCLRIADPCEVIEIKPNSDTGRRSGNEQLEQRRRTFDDQFRNNTLQELIKRCVKDGKLNIQYKLQIYEYCPVGIDQIDVTYEDADE